MSERLIRGDQFTAKDPAARAYVQCVSSTIIAHTYYDPGENRFAASPVGTVSAMSACGAWQAASDTTSSAYHAVFYKQIKELDVDLTARASINPDEANRPCSVSVRVYQLKDRKLFDAASYDDLLKNDKTVLAQDLQANVATVVNPGASASLSQPMQPDTEYVAIVAFYRDPDSDGAWRRVIPKKTLSADTPLKVELVGRELVAATDLAKSRPE